MKKIIRILSLLLIASLLFSFVSCKKDDDGDDGNSDWNPYPYEDLNAFITLADYKSFSISQSYLDRQVNSILSALFEEQSLYVNVTADRGVQEWDFIKIVFSEITVGDKTVYPLPEGSSDEEKNKESSASFTVGTGATLSYIEDAVIGMKLDEEKVLNFTFPDDYTGTKDYAGKDATYKFKVTEHKEPPELTDDLCYRYTTYITADVMRKMFEQEIIYAALWDYMLENSTIVSRPEKEYNEYYNGFVDIFVSYAKSNNKTLEEYVVTEGEKFPSMGLYAGITMDEFYRIAREYADEKLKNDLILYSLIRIEGLKTSGPLYTAAQKELLLSYGVGYTIDSLIEEHGKDQIVTSIMDIQVRRQVLKYVTRTA